MGEVRKCLILAAGRGSRLANAGLPKPLFPLLGVPLIERAIVTAKRAGLSDFTIVTGCAGDQVRRFLDALAVRRSIQITHVLNDDWEAGNGLSVLKAKDGLAGVPFLLLMADHLVDQRLLVALHSESLEDGTVRLAVDHNTGNPVVDLDDVTKVQVDDGLLRGIGKDLGRYNGFDTGCFLCSPVLFQALEQVQAQDADTTLSGAIKVLATAGKVRARDIGDTFWIDVDDARAVERAERLLLSRLHKPTDGPVGRYLNRHLSVRITRHLVRSAITPNQISLFCFALSVLAAAFFAAGGYFLLVVGGLLAQFASVVDGCDGELARLKLCESAYGRWFDAVLDRYSDAFLLFGLMWHTFSVRSSTIVLVVGFLAIVGSFMISYTAEKYDSLLQARVDRRQAMGIRIGRDLRVFMISLGAVTNLPYLTLVLIAGLMNVETVRRIVVAQDDESAA